VGRVVVSLRRKSSCKIGEQPFFLKLALKSLREAKILNDIANGLIAMFVDYCYDVELFGKETRRLCCLVVGRRVESEVSSPSFQPRTVLSPRRARTSSRRLFYESFAPTLSR